MWRLLSGEVWVAPIAQPFLHGEWDESDILKTHGGRDGAKDVWSKILDACYKTVALWVRSRIFSGPRLYILIVETSMCRLARS